MQCAFDYRTSGFFFRGLMINVEPSLNHHNPWVYQASTFDVITGI